MKLTENKKTILQLIIGVIGAFAGLIACNAVLTNFLMNWPIGVRMVAMIVFYWIVAAVPVLIFVLGKDKLSDYGFRREKIGMQILTGLVIAVCMSFVLTLLPIFAGKGDWVDNGHHYTHLWQFAFEFVYLIGAVGLTEEFVFRGFVYGKMKKLGMSTGAAIAVSSVLFGLFHFLSGNIVQLVATGCIGVIFCLCREKIRNCTLLSLIIAHGVYDALITVWASVF